MTGRARARGRARAGGGKIINMALLIPAGALYSTGAPVSQGGGGPNLALKRDQGVLIFYDTSNRQECRDLIVGKAMCGMCGIFYLYYF